MDYIEVKKEIEKGKLFPVYFFFGEERFFIDKLVTMIVNKAVDPSVSDFNYDCFNAEDTEARIVVDAASSFPMMADRRVVVLKDVQKFSSGDKEVLLKYIEDPLDSTSLIITAGQVDRRRKFYNRLIESSHWAESKKLYENQAVEWVLGEVKRKGFTISHEAALFLVGHSGTSLWNLYNEIEKVTTFCIDKKKIDIDDVGMVAGMTRKYNTWELTEAVCRKDLKRALRILTKIIDEGQSPVGIVIDLTRRILILMKIRILLDMGLTHQEAATKLNLRPFFARLFIEQSKRFNYQELERAIFTLRWADVQLKSQSIRCGVIMTMVVYSIIKGEPVSSWE